MRFLGLLSLVLTFLALGAVDHTVLASNVSAQDAVAPSLTQPGAHVGHVTTHQALPGGDMSSMLCKILCAMAASQSPLAVPNSFDSWQQTHETITVAGNIEADEVTPSLQLPPPR